MINPKLNKKHLVFSMFLAFQISCKSNVETINDNYHYVLASDKDDIYQNFLKVKQNHDSVYFDQLIRKILGTENLDLRSINMVVDYLNFDIGKKYRFLVEQKLNQLRKIPIDSQWEIKRNGYVYKYSYIYELGDSITNSCFLALKKYDSLTNK